MKGLVQRDIRPQHRDSEIAVRGLVKPEREVRLHRVPIRRKGERRRRGHRSGRSSLRWGRRSRRDSRVHQRRKGVGRGTPNPPRSTAEDGAPGRSEGLRKIRGSLRLRRLRRTREGPRMSSFADADASEPDRASTAMAAPNNSRDSRRGARREPHHATPKGQRTEQSATPRHCRRAWAWQF